MISGNEYFFQKRRYFCRLQTSFPDIKPDNIIFVDGRAKLSDPGLVADATAENSIAGTPGFIPPEMVSDGLPADRKSDLYAMGKLYYCMVTGNAPREYPLLPVSMPFSVRRQIFPALARMCNRNPSKRFSTASEFLKSLPVHIESPGFGERKYADFKDWKNLNQEKFRLFVCLGIAALLLIISGTGGLLFYRWRLAEEIAACRRAAEKFLSVNRDRRELIELQLAAFLPDSLSRYRQLEEKLQKSVKAQEWRRAAAAAGEQQKMLRSSAERLLPEIPKKSGRMKDFLETCLKSAEKVPL